MRKDRKRENGHEGGEEEDVEGEMSVTRHQENNDGWRTEAIRLFSAIQCYSHLKTFVGEVGVLVLLS